LPRLRAAPVAMLLLAAVALAAGAARAAETLPLHLPDVLAPASTPAAEIRDLTRLLFLITGAIFAAVEGALAWALLRRRRGGDAGREPPQVYGSGPIELAWTVGPLLVVAILFLVTARVVFSLERSAPPRGALRVEVVGHQWWWEFRYPDLGVVTANELHVPIGAEPRPVFLSLETADVIHSFWVPSLAGKADLIPNRVNHLWIEPLARGIYLGQCAEYCGIQHAHMRLRVVVEPEAAFQRWVDAQRRPAAEAPGVGAGRAVFTRMACASCHSVRGTDAVGSVGPDLTHLMSRATLGAGAVPNDAAHLKAWIRDPARFKPGVGMPALRLDETQLDALVAYLRTLG
jgi:cytochrome c oxidase subunit II